MIIKDVALVLENATSERLSGYNSTPDAFVRAVRVLMFGYALVSAGDPAGETWCDLDASFAHISRAEQLVKLDSKSNRNLHARLMDSEMQIRAEWARISQFPPPPSFSEIIEIVSQRHTFWPRVAEFRTPENARSDKWAQPFDKWAHQSDIGEGVGAFMWPLVTAFSFSFFARFFSVRGIRYLMEVNFEWGFTWLV